MNVLRKAGEILFAKKVFNDQAELEETKLARVLTLKDLAFLGIASTLGPGIYITAGQVIKDTGPNAFISFMIAGFCSFLAALSYAELGSRVPRSGSAYIYIYVTIGEFIAFVIGWDIIMEYIVGVASVASMLSQYVDALFDNAVSDAVKQAMPINVANLGPYPDFLGFAFTLIMAGVLVIGVKESSTINIFGTLMNMMVIAFILVVGAIKIDFTNWNLTPNSNVSWTNTVTGANFTCSATSVDAQATNCGTGGFMPYGFQGMLTGAAQSFYALIGFDVICTTGEEVKDAKRTLPIAIMITLGFVVMSLIGVSFVLSLMIPYYMLDVTYPFKTAFAYVDLMWAYYVVSVGAILSLTTCLFSFLYPVPRIVYSLASDRLIYSCFSYVLPKYRTPLVATLAAGLFSASLALIFDLTELINLTSIGTLLAYALVSACNLVLRYRPFAHENIDDKVFEEHTTPTLIEFIFGKSEENEGLFKRMFNPSRRTCNHASAQLTNVVVVTIVIFIIVLCAVLSIEFDNLFTNLWMSVVTVLVSIILLLTFIIYRQPQNQEITTFKAPLVPFVPLAAIFANTLLLTQLPPETLIRFAIWFVIGLFVYTTYGVRNSNERRNRNQTLGCCF